MKHYRLGALATAIAAIALAGCDDSSSSGPGSLKITTENAPFVAADGAALIAGAMDVDDNAGIDELDLGAAVVTSSGDKPQGMTFIQLANIVRGHMDSGETGELLSPELPVGAAVTGGTEVDCETSGSYNYVSTDSTWGVTYNNCVGEFSEEGYESRYTMNGTATGTYDEVGYGGWTANYEALRSTYFSSYDNEEGSGTYSGDYQVDGQFSAYVDYGGYGGSYAYHYGATDLVVKYKYRATGDSVEEVDNEGAGTITYDTYEFMFYNYGGFWYWDGDLYARDSERGIWSIDVLSPFGVNYCAQDVVGSVRLSGRIHEDHDNANQGSNVLVISGDGDNTVNYDLFEADGTTVISEEEENWFEYYDEYTNGCG